MGFVVFPDQPAPARLLGAKAAALTELRRAGFDVPDWFTVTTAAALRTLGRTTGSNRHPSAHPVLEQNQEHELKCALQRLCADGGLVAVRSSASEEDGTRASFAGQLDSFLNIAPDDVWPHIVRVWASAFGERALRYRQHNGDTDPVRPPAVIVQRMVNADAAGVAFSLDPVSGRRAHAVISATRGLGDTLVSGEVHGDSWQVDRSAGIVSRECAESGASLSLTDAEVLRVAELVRRSARHFRRPQDVEWALADGRLLVLQSRPITGLETLADPDDAALWDNSNIVESYGGITTPLTFSVARQAYAGAYRTLFSMLGMPAGTLAGHALVFDNMLGLIRGRVYYNLLNWYRLLAMVPGFRFNRAFMEQMMGVNRTLGDSRALVPSRARARDRIAALWSLIRTGTGLLIAYCSRRRRVRRFHHALNRVLAPVDLQSMSAGALADYFDRLRKELLSAWDAPLANDLFCMIFTGLLRRLSERWLPADLISLHVDLLRGEAGIISLEPVAELHALAALAAHHPALARALRDADPTDLRMAIHAVPAFEGMMRKYLDRFGDRCVEELELASETLHDDPLPMLRTIGHLAMQHGETGAGTCDAQRQATAHAAQRRLRAALAGSPVRTHVYRWVLSQARSSVRTRENTRFERTRAYGRIRQVVLAIGQLLHERNVLSNPRDVFYLHIDELLGFVRGTGAGADLDGLARVRRAEWRAYAAEKSLPRRFWTRGPAQHCAAIQTQLDESDNTASSASDTRCGLGCAPGLVQGRVRIVHDPRTADVQPGDIIVAERTDPGWVTVFPLARGLIVERGSILSHSAIVARELGIPTVVGIDDACRWLSDGDRVELDGGRGQVRRLPDPARQAA